MLSASAAALLLGGGALIDLSFTSCALDLTNPPPPELSNHPTAWTQIMKGGSNVGGKRMSRLSYVVLISLSCVLLLQLSGWSRTLEHTTYSSSQAPDRSRPVQLPLQSNASVTPTSAKAGAGAGASVMETGAGSVQSTAAGSAPALGSPPFRLPKLIHQTVVNKSHLSCEEKRVIESWKKLNPDYTYRLWDDADIRQFMLQHYPELVPVPFDIFVKGAERSDLWRVLVLQKFGGVYADMDVECLKPVDEWNADHGHDAAVLLGMENFDAKRSPHKVHVTNWAIAAVPGHPLLARMPGVVVREIQKQYFALARKHGELSGKLYEQGILERTGPAALTTAMYEYFDSIGVDLNKVTEAEINSKEGVVAGGVRVLPVVSLSTGWEVAEARSKGLVHSCADVAAAKPQALVCHMFWGSWRSTWRTYKQRFTYDNC